MRKRNHRDTALPSITTLARTRMARIDFQRLISQRYSTDHERIDSKTIRLLRSLTPTEPSWPENLRNALHPVASLMSHSRTVQSFTSGGEAGKGGRGDGEEDQHQNASTAETPPTGHLPTRARDTARDWRGGHEALDGGKMTGSSHHGGRQCDSSVSSGRLQSLTIGRRIGSFSSGKYPMDKISPVRALTTKQRGSRRLVKWAQHTP